MRRRKIRIGTHTLMTSIVGTLGGKILYDTGLVVIPLVLALL